MSTTYQDYLPIIYSFQNFKCEEDDSYCIGTNTDFLEPNFVMLEDDNRTNVQNYRTTSKIYVNLKSKI